MHPDSTNGSSFSIGAQSKRLTSQPCSRKRRAQWRPMKPAPPVMRTLAMACGRGLHPLCFVAKSTYERVIIKKEGGLRTNTEGTIMLISAIRRWRIRRLYNAGEWKSAHDLAEKELGKKNHLFATDIILRSMYNQSRW